jgi:hypothetical protein
MASNKAIRSNPLAQPQRRRLHPDPHQKAELFDTLRQLNRGYGLALANLYRLDRHNGKSRIFPSEFLRKFRHQTEELRATANRDLLRLLAGREDQDAKRFAKHQ